MNVRGEGPGRGRVTHFVVQAPLHESDLRSVPSGQWDRLERAFAFERVETGSEPLVAKLRTERGGRELWLPLVLGVLALGVGEMWLARRWSAGGVA